MSAASKPAATKKPAFTAQKAAFNGLAAASLASALVIGPMADAVDMAVDSPTFGSSNLVAQRVTREGIYGEYDVDLGDQIYDDAKSTYKSAKETKTKKGKIAVDPEQRSTSSSCICMADLTLIDLQLLYTFCLLQESTLH